MQRMMTPEVHELLVRECEPIIKAYTDDLKKHDLDFLERWPDTPFLHYTRECGTHMFMMHPTEDLPAAGERVRYLFGEADRDHIARQVVDCAKALARPSDRDLHKLVHHFDGKRLRKIDVDQAVKIAEEYYWALKREWSK